MTLKRLRAQLTHNAMDPNAVDDATVDSQLRTAEALAKRLEQHGGVILGDEVGAGKTFVTFAVLVDRLLQHPRRGAVIFVPSDPLQRKWKDQLVEYLRAAVNDHEVGEKLALRVGIMNRGMWLVDDDGTRRRPRPRDIVIASHRSFSGRVGDADRALCIEQWLERRCQRTIKPRKRFFDACEIDQGDADEDWAVWATRDALTKAVLAPIDQVFAGYEAGRRDLKHELQAAVQTIRRDVARKLLPDASMVVVDEAHHLKSTHSQVYKTLMYVLQGRFDAMLFLTATPFQLGREELRNVVEFFRSSRPSAGAPSAVSFDARVATMDAGMNAYVTALDAFSAAWTDLTPSETEEAERLIGLGVEDGGPASIRVGVAVDAFGSALAAKGEMQEGLRPFIVRSVRKRHHRERPGVEEIPAASRIPSALVDRLISDRLASRKSVFVASALTSACSSWEALFEASIAADDGTQATLEALRAMRDQGLLGVHPKTRSTIMACVGAATDRQEKTLVFVERRQTGRALRDALKHELPDGRDNAGYARLQDAKRFGWPSLRENYLHTIYVDVFGAPPSCRDCLDAVAESTMTDLWHRVDVDEKLDYKRAKRIVEHAAFRLAVARKPHWARGVGTEVRSSVENLLEEDYVVNGLDLISGASNERLKPPSVPVRSVARPIGPAFVEAFAAYPSPWASSREALATLDPHARAEIVDAAAAAVASSHLQAEVVRLEADGDPATHFRGMQGLLATDEWRTRFEAIAQQAADLVAGDRAGATSRVLALASALRASERVQFVSGETSNDTKAHAIAGFNTPLYPEVLIATGVLAEGVDLHRSCRRVIHHDLPWNPAKLEQRTGRVDRIGSLSARLQQAHGDVDASAVDVGMPFVAGTYDETIFNRVLARRREFRCLLGNRPEWDQDEVDADETAAWPEAVALGLQVHLGPA